MNNAVIFKTIDEYNKTMGVETLHPLVTVVDLSKSTYLGAIPDTHTYQFFTVFLKDIHCADIIYGRNTYDYQEGTLVFLGPNQTIKLVNRQPHQPKGWALMFHPDLLRGTSLSGAIKDYSFFSYNVHEALHISQQERAIVLECFQNIENELHRGIDKHSQRLIVSNIELFLNYCVRFYDRQFITREPFESEYLTKFNFLMNEYFRSDVCRDKGLPTVKYFADKLCLSPNYMGDLIKKETGKTPQEHIQLALVEHAKRRLLSQTNSISDIASELGFEYPQYFSRFFKKKVGMSPAAYRLAHA